MRALCLVAVPLIAVGCQRTSEASAPPAPAPLPVATSDTSQDPLRMPPELHLRKVRQLSFGGRAFAPVFSRDGNRLAFLSVPAASRDPDAGVPPPVPHLVDVRTGAEQPLPTAAQPALADLWLSPAGDLCGDVAGGGSRELGTGRCAPPHWPLSRGGRCASTAAGDWACVLVAASGAQLWLWQAGTPTPHAVDTGPGDDADPAFSPGGQMLAWSSTRGETPGTPGGRVPSGIEILTAAQFGRPAPAQTEASAAGPSQAVSPPGQANQHPSFFPSGNRLLFASNADDAAGRDMDIFRVGADGQGLERITFAPGADIDPAVSPDGHFVAWVSERNAAAPGEQDVLVAEWVE